MHYDKSQLHHTYTPGLEKPRFFEKAFRFLKVFLDFTVEIRLDTKFPPRKKVHSSLSFRAFSVKYNKTHKSRLKYEI